MQPKLILQPVHNSSADILRCFAEGKPLSVEQQHFLEWHDKQLSSKLFDPVLKYYVESEKKRHKSTASFLLAKELTNESLRKFKERLHLFLQQKYARIVIPFTQKQFLQFQRLTSNQLIFWHGNQFLTGAPFIPGGIPPVLFFQWGNFFGVVKYVILTEEKTLKANILVYFEDMQEKDLNQCVVDYKYQFEKDLSAQHQILHENKIIPTSFDKFLIKPPIPRPDPFYTQQKE